MRECIVLAETDSLTGLNHSLVDYVINNQYKILLVRLVLVVVAVLYIS
jgi:hypothetical protein